MPFLCWVFRPAVLQIGRELGTERKPANMNRKVDCLSSQQNSLVWFERDGCRRFCWQKISPDASHPPLPSFEPDLPGGVLIFWEPTLPFRHTLPKTTDLRSSDPSLPNSAVNEAAHHLGGFHVGTD